MNRYILIRVQNGYGYIYGETFTSGMIYHENAILVAADFEKEGKRLNMETKEWEEYTPEPEEKIPTQLDRIEEAVQKSHDEIANEAIDAYTLELSEEGLL